MLAVVVAAGLSPNTGVVQASSNCTYGQCPAAQPFPLWAVGSAVAAVVVALLLAFLLLRRRRRPGQPPSQWEGGEGSGGPPPGAGGSEGGGLYETAAVGGAAMGAGAVEPMWQEGESAPPSEEPSPGAEYLETPSEEAPSIPPAPAPAPVPPAPAAAVPAAAAAASAPAAGEEAEPDIDSLMAELEKISGEILKQKPKKRNGPPSSGDTDDSSP
jgi:hypothetical protein